MTYGLSNDTFAWTIATDEADEIFINKFNRPEYQSDTCQGVFGNIEPLTESAKGAHSNLFECKIGIYIWRVRHVPNVVKMNLPNHG